MKLQFSLATLLVCMTVLAVTCAIAALIPKHTEIQFTVIHDVFSNGRMRGIPEERTAISDGPPSVIDIGGRFAVWGPCSIAATFVALWTIRRLKSRATLSRRSARICQRTLPAASVDFWRIVNMHAAVILIGFVAGIFFVLLPAVVVAHQMLSRLARTEDERKAESQAKGS